MSPLIHLLSNENRSFEGESITLRCEAAGFPLPLITWASNSPANTSMEYFNERTAVIQDRETFTTVSELTLRNATLPLRGNYECIARNSLGVVEDHIAVVIYGELLLFFIQCSLGFIFGFPSKCNNSSCF